ncbi:Arc family DNA-binding protein [Agrobacterium sp. 16-172Ci]
MKLFSAFNVRLPLELKAWLSDQAGKNGRSLNAEIIQIIKTARSARAEEEA